MGLYGYWCGVFLAGKRDEVGQAAQEHTMCPLLVAIFPKGHMHSMNSQGLCSFMRVLRMADSVVHQQGNARVGTHVAVFQRPLAQHEVDA
ncbi:hypothetical protein DVU_1565 [Nitratidesulfovibrio vulgaris str. Hildenborough]|uniref:Uncharacterized protein n=1 Tax=Nitratidesulfovibrio vulgaris (strain ATCC 29579 / DSM 644 / CCUG 34227 / NCIMB 8303 / VKM B-1760 / Hildenborough) TaxID=882 RepID=Q72BR9_NITV2|nr:hypothetical protein DVU_1565 [Nitratidesulfovibrio vulgaris str. Hildenborough]